MISIKTVIVCTTIFLLLLASICFCGHFNTFLPIECRNGSTLSFVAHQDDDLLFLNPDIVKSIHLDKCTITVFATTGDGGLGNGYWENRELGSRAAYAVLAKAQDKWVENKLDVNSFEIYSYKLASNPHVILIFMRLPDGNIDGSGFSSNNFESLQKLWEGKISQIHSVDSKEVYSSKDVTKIFTYFMTAYKPNNIYTQDYVGKYGDSDHSDHHSVAYFVKMADQNYKQKHVLVGFLSYRSAGFAANLNSLDAETKMAAFFAYAKHDPFVCQTESDCNISGIRQFFVREYTLNQDTESFTK